MFAYNAARATSTIPRVQGDPEGKDPASPAEIERLRDLRGIDRAVVAAGLAFVVGGAVLLLVALRHQGRTPIGDEAVIARLALDAPAQRQLVGQATTAGLYGAKTAVFQPGPSQFWLMFPLVRVFGAGFATNAFALLVNVGSILLATWAAFRVAGKRAATLTLIFAFSAAATAIPSMFSSSWNATIVAVPMFCSFVLAWAVAKRDLAMLPPLVFLVSFVLQGEVPNAGPPLAATAVALGFVAVHARTHRLGVAPRRWIAITGAVLAAMWILPAWDQVAGTGNLGRLLGLSLPHAGVDGALRTVGTLLDWPLALRVKQQLQPADLHRVNPSALLAVAAVIAVVLRRRRQLQAHRELLAVAGGVLTGAVIWGGFRPADDPFAYHLFWVKAAGWFVLLAVVVLAASAVQPRLAAIDVALKLAAAWLLVATVLGVYTHEASRWSGLDQGYGTHGAVVKALVREAHAAAPGPHRLRAVGGYQVTRIAQGMLAVLSQWSNDEDRPGKDSLVVVGALPAVGEGPLIATTAAPGAGRPEQARTVDAVQAYVRAHRPLALVGDAASQLVPVLNGTPWSACGKAIQQDPDLLLELPRPVLVAIYSEFVIVSPTLPPDLQARQRSWVDHQRYELHRLRPSGDEPGRPPPCPLR